MGDPLPALSPPTFSTLPPEIKRMIASEAYKQDKAYRVEDSALVTERRGRIFHSTAPEWDGHSLNALFLLDRAWSAVAAPFVFRRIDQQNCSSRVFRGAVLRKYARFVEEVAFWGDLVMEENHQEIVVFIHLFPRLRRLELEGCHCYALFDVPRYLGLDDTPCDEALNRREAFRSATTNVEELVVHTPTSGVLEWLLESPPRLKRLSILTFLHDGGGGNPRSAVEDRGLFEAIVSGCQHLLELDVSDYDDSRDEPGGIGFGDSWHLHDWKCRSTLRSLKLHAKYEPLNAARWSFVQHFAATLELLDLGSLPESPAAAGTFGPSSSLDQPVNFPALRTLAASTNFETATLLLRRLTSSPLQFLTLRLSPDGPRVTQLAIMKLHDQLEYYRSGFRELTISHGNASESTAFDSQVAVPAVLPVGPFRTVFHHHGVNVWTERSLERQELDPHHPPDIEKRCNAIDEVARFALNLSGRLRVTGDVYGAEEMMLALVPLKSLMIREQL